METQTLTTTQYREQLSTIIQQELTNLPTLLADLSPKERAGLILKLLPYVLPKKDNSAGGVWGDSWDN